MHPGGGQLDSRTRFSNSRSEAVGSVAKLDGRGQSALGRRSGRLILKCRMRVRRLVRLSAVHWSIIDGERGAATRVGQGMIEAR